MAWDTSNRRDRLPPDWEKRRKFVLRRDNNQCQHRDDYGRQCGEHANQVDHIIPNDDHSYTNLRALCEYHHSKKSSYEGGAAKAAARRRIANRFKRVESHPGLL